MYRSRAALALLAVSAATMVAGAAVAQQQQQAGVAAAVRGRVEVAMTAGAVGREVKSGEPIYLGNAIKSGADSGMQILLLDQTTFTIGPNSEITIDQFVFDPASGTGKVAASVAKGVFRFVTGKVAQTNPNDMTVRLPTGNIGIRGTIAVGSVEPGANGQPLKQEVVLLGPGSGREGAARVGSIVLTGGGSPVTINQPGFGSQFGSGSGWGTPVRYTPEMINALQSRLDTPISGKGPGAAAQGGQAGQQAGQQGAPPPGPGGPGQGPPGQGPLGQLGQVNTLAFLGAQDQQTCQQSNVSSCTNLNPPPGMSIGAITDGASTFEQLRSVASGTFFYSSSNTPMSGGGGGGYDLFVDINFGNRTIGGGNSRVEVNTSAVFGSLSFLTQSFATGSGTATFTQGGIAGLSGALCSPSCSTTISITPQNSGGVAGVTANHSVTVTGSGTVSGSGSATRQAGSSPIPQ